MQIQNTFQNPRPTLFLITTPIGNLGTISTAVKPILQKLQYLLCEDTQHTQKLLRHLNLTHLKLFSFHKFNENERQNQVLRWLATQTNVGLVSCAGVPLIADPGLKLVQTVLKNDYYVTSVGLNNSGLAALITSGLPTHQFYFMNFLTTSSTKKRQLLQQLAGYKTTFVFFESVHRLKTTLKLFCELWPQNRFALARELTKQHETIYRGQFDMLKLNDIVLKGEFVLTVDNWAGLDQTAWRLQQFQQIIAPLDLTVKQKIILGNKLYNIPRKTLTRLFIKTKHEKTGLH